MLKWSAFWTTFGLLVVAEMGDKTQLAAITLAAETRAPVSVFLGAALALTLVSLVGVALGALLGQYLPTNLLHKAAALAFIVIGALMLWGKL
ncbi:MAG TPA: TMEM165/GDT1 family protein [Pyrinomonadaceae bacterium]|jgi:putative Ca2+/H+ antiporter (TMEM165/GDT1 family)|nr:TMEM165/GDT1 family protein [Pyrinomonadaceae bacterium]